MLLSEQIDKMRLMMGLLNESRMHITVNEVPGEIMVWARNQVRSNFSKNIVINRESTVEINMPWHEADRQYWQFFQLLDGNRARMAGDVIGRSGLEGDGVVTGNEVNGKVKVPSGYVLASVGTYPVRLELYVSDDALKPISDSNILDQFSVTELVILLQAKGLKSPYRTKYPDKEYEKLIANGYLLSNRSITVKGRNIAEMPEVKEKINDWAKERGLYLDGSYKLSKSWGINYKDESD